MLHPLVVHFAIAVPVILVVLEIINFMFRRKSLGFINFMLMILIFVIFVVAYYTGQVDAQNAKEMMSQEAKDLLQSHRDLGVVLIYGSAIIMFFKILGFASQKILFRIIFFVGALAFIFGVFNEGKMGGDLVYKHGTNVAQNKTSAAAKQPAVNDAAGEQTAPVKQETQSAPTTNTNTNLPEETKNTTNPVSETTQNIVNTTQTTIDSAAEKTENVVKKAINNTGETINNVTEQVKNAAQKTIDNADETINKAIETVTPNQQ